jgi:hypothetical protein
VDDKGMTVLHAAARSGGIEIVSLLLKKGMMVDVQAADGSTPLLIAIINNQPECAAYIAEQGANLDSATKDGKTPRSEAKARNIMLSYWKSGDVEKSTSPHVAALKGVPTAVRTSRPLQKLIDVSYECVECVMIVAIVVDGWT